VGEASLPPGRMFPMHPDGEVVCSDGRMARFVTKVCYLTDPEYFQSQSSGELVRAICWWIQSHSLTPMASKTLVLFEYGSAVILGEESNMLEETCLQLALRAVRHMSSWKRQDGSGSDIVHDIPICASPLYNENGVVYSCFNPQQSSDVKDIAFSFVKGPDHSTSSVSHILRKLDELAQLSGLLRHQRDWENLKPVAIVRARKVYVLKARKWEHELLRNTMGMSVNQMLKTSRSDNHFESHNDHKILEVDLNEMSGKKSMRSKD
jgi:hypothetical protein